MPYDPKLGPGNQYLIDEQRGLVYQIGSDGQRHYVSPAAMTPAQLRMSQQEQATGQPRNADEFLAAGFDRSQIPDGGFFRGRGEWDAQKGEFDQPFNWGNLMGLGIGGAIAAPFAASALGGMFGGSGSAAAGGGAGAASSTPGVLASSALPTAAQNAGMFGPMAGVGSGGALASSALPSAATSAGMFGPSAGIPSGTLASSPLPAAATNAGMFGPSAGIPGGSATVAGGSGGSGLVAKLSDGLGGRAVESAIAGLAGLPGLMRGGPSDQEQALTRRLEEILAQQQRRTTEQDPLFSAVTRMAGQLMPNSAWGSGGNPYGR